MVDPRRVRLGAGSISDWVRYSLSLTGDVLRIVQRQAGLKWQSIAPEADAEIISIEGHSGEFVTGAWALPAVESSPQPSETLPANWGPNARLQILRRRTDSVLYANPIQRWQRCSRTGRSDCHC